MRSIDLILLAAGGSSRMGSPKQLLPYLGKPLIRHAAEVALASFCRNVVIVLGANRETIEPALNGLPVRIIENERWEEGMGTSIRAGVNAAMKEGAEGVILALADQPLVTKDIFNRLIEEHERTGQPVVSSEYSGTVGVPVFFGWSLFSALQSLPASQGCKGLILKHNDQAVRLHCPEAEVDIDTPDDYDQVRAHVHGV